jgi:hypothetical protein
LGSFYVSVLTGMLVFDVTAASEVMVGDAILVREEDGCGLTPEFFRPERIPARGAAASTSSNQAILRSRKPLQKALALQRSDLDMKALSERGSG